MTIEEFMVFLKALLKIISSVSINRSGEENRLNLSFRIVNFDSKILDLIKKYNLHLIKQEGTVWEFEINLIERE